MSTSEGNIFSGLQNETEVFTVCNTPELPFKSTPLDFWRGVGSFEYNTFHLRWVSVLGGSEEFWTGNSLYWVYWASNSFGHAIKTWSWFKFKRYLQACSRVRKRVFILQIKQWKIIGPNFRQKFLLSLECRPNFLFACSPFVYVQVNWAPCPYDSGVNFHHIFHKR